MLLGYTTEPIWFYSGITVGQHLLPGSPVLDPNIGVTSEALGRLAARDWVHGVVPWWNPYSGIGMPLAGEMQPSAFFLPFNLLLLLPNGVLLMQLVLQALSGLATYGLLRELKLGRGAAFAGGVLFGLNGTLAWSPASLAGNCAVPFLPLLLWGIEMTRHSGRRAAGALAVGIAIGWSLLSGFPEIAYIDGLLALAWGLWRLSGEKAKKQFILYALLGAGAGLALAAPQLLSFFDYLRQSDALSNHKLLTEALPSEGLGSLFLPYLLGPPGGALTAKSLWRVWSQLGGYSTELTLLFAVIGIMSRQVPRGLRLLLALWTLLVWAKSFGVPPFGFLIGHIPLLGAANFSRYATTSWELALIVLAAYGVERACTEPLRVKTPLLISTLILLAALLFASPIRAYWGWSRSEQLVMTVFLLLSAAWATLMLGLATVVLKRSPKRLFTSLLLLLLAGDAAMLFMLPRLNAVKGRSIDTAAIAFLQNHQGLERTYTMGPIPPNYGAYFGLRQLDHIALPVPRLWAHYVDEHLLPDVVVPGGYPGQNFTPLTQAPGGSETALRINLLNFEDMGVRYVVTNPGASPVSPPAKTLLTATKAERVATWVRSLAARPGEPKLLHAVAVELLKRLPAPPSAQGGPELAARSTGERGAAAQALGIRLVYQDAFLWVWELPHPSPYYQILPGSTCTLAHASDTAVDANCTGPATLERRELFMPGWTARVVKSDAAVHQNGIFQTVTLPAGESEIRFRFSPPGMFWGWLASGAGATVLLLLGALATRKPGGRYLQHEQLAG